MDDPVVVTLAERPGLAGDMWAMGEAIWPAFMLADPVADRYYGRVEADFADTCLLAVEDGELVARAFFVPFTWNGRRLPDRGWDAIIERATADHDAGRAPTAAAALEIGVMPAARKRGLSGFMLASMRAAVRARGLHDLFAPVRPSAKYEHPREPMATYMTWTTDAGLPADPWLRVHVRAGGRIVKVAPASMRIDASLPRWRAWTSAPLDSQGQHEIPGGLVPLEVDVDADVGTYIEPNVWVHHDLR